MCWPPLWRNEGENEERCHLIVIIRVYGRDRCPKHPHPRQMGTYGMSYICSIGDYLMVVFSLQSTIDSIQCELWVLLTNLKGIIIGMGSTDDDVDDDHPTRNGVILLER